LTLHPEKTQLTEFRKPPQRPEGPGAPGGGGTFDLLGFTHFWARSLKGTWVVRRKTAQDRFNRALKKIKEWCRLHRHDEIKQQAQGLSQRLRGHFGYFGIQGNSRAIGRFRQQVVILWRKHLGRRSQNGRVTWERMVRILRRHPLPPARLAHPLSLA